MRCHSSLLVVLPWCLLVAGCGDAEGPAQPGDFPAATANPAGSDGTTTVAPTPLAPSGGSPNVSPFPAASQPIAPGAVTMPNSGAPSPGGSTPTNGAPGPVDGAGLGGVDVDGPTPAATPSTPAVSPSTPATNPSMGAGGNDGTGTDPDVTAAPSAMPVFPQPGNTGDFPAPGGMGGGMAGTGGTPGGTTTNPPDDGPEIGDNGPIDLDCDATMPTSGEQQHSGNGTGGDGNLAWEIWSNTGQGELTSYDVPAFSAIWNEAGGYLGRLGYEWGGPGDTPVPHEQRGTITAQFVAHKSGTAGGYSYVGMYGWSTDPCVEWYVVEDSYNNMPVGFNDLDSSFGDQGVERGVNIDGGSYLVYKRPTEGTGGTRCSGETRWDQYYSVRTTARNCGQISLTEHFEAWENLGLPMGNLLEAKIVVEVGGGQGRVDLPIANVIVTP